jgi:hypothetical protein
MGRMWVWIAATAVSAGAAIVVQGCTVGINRSAEEIVITRLAEPVPSCAPEYPDLWSALGGLYTDYEGVDRPAGSERDTFLQAAGMFLSREYAAAAATAGSLRHTASERVVRAYAQDLQLNSLYAQGLWRECVDAAPDPAAMAAGDTTSLADPDMYPFLLGWAQAPPESCLWQSDRIVLPLKKNSAHHALVPVDVNGVRKWFVVDTGAAVTVISNKVARQTGVRPLGKDRGSLGTATDIEVQAVPATIADLRLGDLVFKNHRVFYMNQKDLEFKLLFIPLVRIEGILGWNAIAQMHLELDFEAEQATITRPTEQPTNRAREIAWVGEEGPLVQLQSKDGTGLWFFLDTGANATDLNSDITSKLDLAPANERTSIRGGAGGMRKVTESQVPDFTLLLDGYSYTFDRLSLRQRERETGPHGYPESWACVDGVLGMDIISRGRVIIDAAAGRFDVIPASAAITPAPAVP